MLLEISALQVRSRREAYGNILPPESRDVTPEAWAAERAAWLTRQGPEFRSWAAYEGQQFVGFCDTGLARDDDLLANAREVLLIYVDAGLNGRGYGKALLTHAVTDMAARGVNQVVLWTPEGNDNAQAFYEKRGWRRDGARRPYTPFGAKDAVGFEVRYALVELRA